MQVSSEIIAALQVLREHLDSQTAPNTTVFLNLSFQKLLAGESKTAVSYCLERIPKQAEPEPARQAPVSLVAEALSPESASPAFPGTKETAVTQKTKPFLVV